MAGRIRTLKPELLDTEVMAALSSDAWRVFVSAVLLADDHGNLRAAPRLLAAHVFHDTTKVAVIERALDELSQLPEPYKLLLYRVGGELFAHLTGWAAECSVGQYIRTRSSARVPTHDREDAQPVLNISSTCAPSVRNRRTGSNRIRRPRMTSDRLEQNPTASDDLGQARTESDGLGQNPTESARARARRSPISDHRSPITDPRVVAVPDPIKRARTREGASVDDDDQGDHEHDGSPDSEPPPTARSRAAPTPRPEPTAPAQDSPAAASAPPAPTSAHPSPPIPPPAARPRRARWEPQSLPGRLGEPLIDPATGRQLVLDVAALTPAEVEAERARCLAALPPPAPPGVGVAGAAPPPDRRPPSSPGLMPHDGDVEAAVRDLLRAAPPPICHLADRSAARLASGLVGGQLRLADIPNALRAAGMKLDRRFESIRGPSAPEGDLEALHRFVAGFLVQAPVHRASTRSSAAVPPDGPSEAGTKLLEKFRAQYRARFGRDYDLADDDALNATEIAAELGKRLERERAAAPDLDVKRTRGRLVSRLFEAWFDDPFGQRSGHALRRLAALLRDEPNRFQLGEAGPRGVGAAAMAADPIAVAPPPLASAAQRAEVEAELAKIGAVAPARST